MNAGDEHVPDLVCPVAWGVEPPIASMVAVAGTPCRCTVSRHALERLAGTTRLGPYACLDALERNRARIETIAARKYAREGVGDDRCIHVTSADIVRDALADLKLGVPDAPSQQAAPPAVIAA